MSIHSKDVVRSVKWVALVKLLSQCATFAITIAILRFISKEEFGLATMAFVVMGFIDNLIDFGLASAIVQRKEVSHREYSSCFWALVGLGVVAAGLLYVSSPLFGLLFRDTRLEPLIELLAVTLFAVPIQVLYRAMLQREYKLDRLAQMDLAGLVIRSVGALMLAIDGFGVWSLVVGFTAEKILVTLLLLFSVRWRPMLHFAASELTPFISFGMKITVGRIIYFFLYRIDVVVVSRVLGAEVLGVYNLALQFSNMIAQLITTSGINIVYPLFARSQGTPQFAQHIYRSEEFIAILVVPVLAGLSLVAHDLVLLSLGPHWIAAASYLQYLCFATMFQVLGFLLPQAFSAADKAMVNVYINVVSLFIYAAAFFVAGQLWGIYGILIAAILVTATRFALILAISRQLLEIEIGKILRGILEAAFASALMVLVTATVANVLFPEAGSYYRMAFIVILGVAVYLLVQWLFFREKVTTMYLEAIGR